MLKVIIFTSVVVVSVMGGVVSYPPTSVYNKPAESVVFPQPVNYISQPSYLKPEYNSPYGASSAFVNPHNYTIPNSYPCAPMKPSPNYIPVDPNSCKAPKYIAKEIIPAVVVLPSYSNSYPAPVQSPTAKIYESYNNGPLIYKASKPCSGGY